MTSEHLILIGTLGGALIGSLSTLITTYITKHFEEKTNYRKIICEAAITDWRNAMKIASKSGGKKVFPLDSYLISHSKTFDALTNKKISKEELKKLLKENTEISKMWLEESLNASQELKKVVENNGA